MIKLVDILKELNIKPKKPSGLGSRHIVYPSQSDPNKVIKTININPDYDGNEYNTLDIDSLELFKKYPNVFPKVYKITNKYAVLEKLNTSKVFNELKNLYNQVIESNTEFSEYIKDKYTGYDRSSNEFSTDIYEYIKYEDKTLSDFDEVYSKIKDGELLKKYVLFIFTIIKLFPQSLDIHNDQFGYDSEGNIKLLDI
jgi:hypothetical protein